MKHEETLALRKKQLEDFNVSGQSAKAWCQDHHIPLPTFHYWKKRLAPSQQVSDEKQWIQLILGEAFHLEQEEQIKVSTPIILYYQAIRIELNSGFDKQALRQILNIITNDA